MKYTLEIIKYITLFENLTGAKVKDCIPEPEQLVFIVEEQTFSKALQGKKRIEGLIKKDVKLIKYSDDIQTFIQQLIYPVQADVTLEQNIITITPQNSSDRGKIYGRGRERLDKILALVKRYFTSIESINVK